MPEMSPEEAEFLTARIARALARGGFDRWETSFLQDMRARLGGARPRLSDKQSRKLHAVLSRSNPRLTTLPGRRWQRRWGARRWRGTMAPSHRLLRGLIFLAVMVLFFGLHQIYLDFASRGSNTPAAQTFAQHGEPAAELTASRTPANDTNVSQGLAGSIRVIDGDTVDVKGEHVRLVGLNTPETYDPRCAAELALGMRAKERLRQLLANGTPQLVKVPCACKPGTEGTQRCNYGRSCGILSVNGRDVADTLISEGLAVPFQCSGTGCPRLPRPWCGEG